MDRWWEVHISMPYAFATWSSRTPTIPGSYDGDVLLIFTMALAVILLLLALHNRRTAPQPANGRPAPARVRDCTQEGEAAQGSLPSGSPTAKRLQRCPGVMLYTLVLTCKIGHVDSRFSRRRAPRPAWTPGEAHSRGAMQGAARNAELQRNLEVLKIHETNTNRKLGVVARRSLPKGYRIIYEPATFSCYQWGSGKRTAVEEWSELSSEHRRHMRLLHTVLRKVPDGGKDAFKERDKRRLESFISDYAFSDPQRDRAHIYELTCYINHACSTCANAEFWVDSDWPNSITVKLVRDVKKNDEIFICYHKPSLYFGCALCRYGETLRGRLGRLLFIIRNLSRRRCKANANETEPASDDAGISAAPDSSASNDIPSDKALVNS
ncbi:hypothetical protein LLEC1_03009 [Akanthomyces lecanii]|uniref:SET domain-containing protein n=1 Tax=Cordyceps confragosa TaxID=2714763 RepID=A0A179I709_CORDF|nr:hypothetical protein LLEC1_03009 [Akanthomyces lecanii]